MTLVFLCFPSSSVPSSEENAEMSPICNDKKHSENVQGISFSSNTNSSNDSNDNFFGIDGQETGKLFVGKNGFSFNIAKYRLVNKLKI